MFIPVSSLRFFCIWTYLFAWLQPFFDCLFGLPGNSKRSNLWSWSLHTHSKNFLQFVLFFFGREGAAMGDDDRLWGLMGTTHLWSIVLWRVLCDGSKIYNFCRYINHSVDLVKIPSFEWNRAIKCSFDKL